jgi:hypothetical protein
MKALMILGGMLGFLVGGALGLAQTGTWTDALWRASVTTLAGGFLLRWWGHKWLECYRQAQAEKLAAAAPTEPTLPTTKGN